MNKRWIFLIMILCLAISSLSCGISVDLGAKKPSVTPPPPAIADTPEPATETNTVIPPTLAVTLAPKATATTPVMPTEKPVEKPEAPAPAEEPVAAPEPQAQVISPENSASLTLKRAPNIGSGSLQKVMVSPDGKSILLSYSTSLVLLNMDNLAPVWNVDPGKYLTDVTFSKDGEHLVSVSPGGSVQLFDVATGNPLATILVQREGVKSVSISGRGEYFAVLDYSGVTTIYDTVTGKPVQDNNGAANPGGILSILLSPGGGTFLIEGYDSKPNKQIQQWNVTDGKYKIGLLGILQEMVNWKFSPDAKRIFGINTRSLTASPSNVLTAWNAMNGAVIKTYPQMGMITDYKISPDGTTILVATEDNQIHVLDVETGNSKGSFTGHQGEIAGMDFTPDSQGVVSVSVDGKLIVWDVVNQKQVKEQVVPAIFPKASMMFSASGRLAAFLSPDMKTIGILQTSTFAGIAKFGPEEYTLRSPSISSQGKLVAAMDEKNHLIIWDVATGKKLQTIETKTRRPISKLKFAPNEKLISSLSEGQIIIWDVNTGAKLKEMAGQNDFDYSPVEKIIVSDSTDNRLYFSDVDSGKLLYATGADFINTISYSPGGEYIAVGGVKVQPKERGLTNLIYQVDAHTRERLAVEMPEIPGTVSSTAYSPDMHLLAASDSQGNIHIWNLLDGKKVALFNEVVAYPSSLAFNADGTLLYAGGGDGTIGIISTSGSGAATDTTPPAATGENTLPELSAQPYTHSKGSVTVNLPMGWKLNEQSASMFTATDPAKIGSIAFMATNTINPLSDEAFLNYINGSEAFFATSAPGLKETDRGIEPAKGTGFVTKTVPLAGKEYIFETYYTRDGSVVYQLNFFTQKAYADLYTSLYQGVFASLKVNKEFISKQSPYDDLSGVNTKGGKYSYSIPTGWYQYTGTLPTGVTLQYNAPDNSALLQTAISDFTSGDQAADTQAYITMQTLLEKQEGAVTIVRRDKVESGGWQITYSLPDKNKNGIIIGTQIDSTLQMLNVQFDAAFDAQYRPLAERIIASLKKL